MITKKQVFNNAASACLLGIPCRWNAKSKVNKKTIQIFNKGKTLVVCPELLARLGVPRPACEIKGGDGYDVLSGKARIVDKKGRDYTEQFIRGAKIALSFIKKYRIHTVYLKSGSPSCGSGFIYSGLFNNRKVKGYGLFAALLHKNKIRTINLK